MAYDFDNVPSRKGTYSFKFDFAEKMGHDPDELPMWVADMDFPSPPGVAEAICSYAQQGFFGYSDAMDDYADAVIGWFERRHGITYDRDWLVRTPGVVFAINNAVCAFTNPGDAVLIQTPVYQPFALAARLNGRKLVENELVYNPEATPSYTIDFEDFERKIDDFEVKVFVLCSPHNPVGRVWTAEELARMGAICAKHDVLIVSDEVHCDLLLYGNRHIPFLTACPEMASRTVVCTAPSKTFSLAGLQTSNIWIPDDDLRKSFCDQLASIGHFSTNLLGIIACKAAYETGDDWLDEAIAYIQGNVDYQRSFLEAELPQLKLVEPQGTYLTWVDMSALGMEAGELDSFVQHKAKLWLDGGSMFVSGGDQFQRFNLACPRSTVVEAMNRLKAAIG
ncbi:MAG: MalY/PatB family protein [Coriobacteriales bacterium]|jgi:cystathionine beta-lyase